MTGFAAARMQKRKGSGRSSDAVMFDSPARADVVAEDGPQRQLGDAGDGEEAAVEVHSRPVMHSRLFARSDAADF